MWQASPHPPSAPCAHSLTSQLKSPTRPRGVGVVVFIREQLLNLRLGRSLKSFSVTIVSCAKYPLVYLVSIACISCPPPPRWPRRGGGHQRRRKRAALHCTAPPVDGNVWANRKTASARPPGRRAASPPSPPSLHPTNESIEATANVPVLPPPPNSPSFPPPILRVVCYLRGNIL